MPEASPSASRSLILGLAAAVVLALGLGGLVYTRQPPALTPPATQAEAPAAVPSPSEPRQSEPSTGGETAAETPVAATGVAGVAGGGAKPAAGAEADAGANPRATSGKAGTAGKPADRPPLGGGRGTAGAPPPLTAQAMMRRSFVPSRSASENVRSAGKQVSGFDAKKSKEVQVKHAPEIDARIEFSTTPQRVRPGDKYQVRVALVNEGKKPIELKEIHITTKVNGKEIASEAKPLVKEVESHQNEVVHQLEGNWDKGTTSWSLDVRILSSRSDVYRSQLTWK